MRLISFLILLPFLALTSCEFNEHDIELEKEFQLKPGKTYEFMGYELTLKSINDSRCPLDVECVWEGEARLTFELEVEDADSSFVLSTQDKLEYRFSEYTLRLLDVAPYPVSDKDIDQEDYRISIRIETNIP